MVEAHASRNRHLVAILVDIVVCSAADLAAIHTRHNAKKQSHPLLVLRPVTSIHSMQAQESNRCQNRFRANKEILPLQVLGCLMSQCSTSVLFGDTITNKNIRLVCNTLAIALQSRT